MQVISRVEQQPSSASSIVTPKSLKHLMRAIAEVLESGKTSAHQMKILSDYNNERLGFEVEDDHQHSFDHHSRVTLNAFETCLSMLTSYDFDHQEGKIINNKRKIDRIHDVQSSDYDYDHDHDHDHSSKSKVISDANVSKDRSYKGRKTGPSRTVEATTLIDDGYAWRKYGQKDIQNTKYPRSYYRCTNKYEQNCEATRQVQQISKNPNKYNIIYHGKHTCKKNSSIIIDNSTFENSSCLLSFDTKNYHTPKHALNSTLFPPLAFLNSTAHHDHHSCGAQKQHSSTSSSSSSDNICPPSSSSDLTSTGLSSTPVSSDRSDVISPLDEVYSSTSTPYEMDEDVFISLCSLDQDYHPHLDGLF